MAPRQTGQAAVQSGQPTGQFVSQPVPQQVGAVPQAQLPQQSRQAAVSGTGQPGIGTTVGQQGVGTQGIEWTPSGQLRPVTQQSQLGQQPGASFAQPVVQPQQLGTSYGQFSGAAMPQAVGQQTPQGQWTQQLGQATAQQPGQMATPQQGQEVSGAGGLQQSPQASVQSFPAQGGTLSGAVQASGEGTQKLPVGQPSIDMVDAPDEIRLFVDLPGFKEEDIRIQADGQNLTIYAERREEEQEDGTLFARERSVQVQRTVQLPSRADVSEAEATYENGVCTITLPKMEEEKQQTIGIQ